MFNKRCTTKLNFLTKVNIKAQIIVKTIKYDR